MAAILPGMDEVFITDLRANTILGVYDYEREAPREVEIDIRTVVDLEEIAATDDLDKAVDYERLSNRVVEYLGDNSFYLVETLAHRLAAVIQQEFGLPWLRIEVRKRGAIPFVGAFGVVAERGVRPS